MSQYIFIIIQLFIAGLFGFGFNRLNSNMNLTAERQEKARQQERLAEQAKQEQAEKERHELMLLILQSTVTNRTLSKATAIAIKDGKCNGEVDQALKEADRVDKKQAEYLQKVGVRQVL